MKLIKLPMWILKVSASGHTRWNRYQNSLKEADTHTFIFLIAEKRNELLQRPSYMKYNINCKFWDQGVIVIKYEAAVLLH